jgi:hypothetical protein
MNTKLLAQGLLLGMKSLGIMVDKLDENVLYISVPSATTDARHPLAGRQLAAQLKSKFAEMCNTDIIVKYKVRDEVWTKEKADLVLQHKA